MSRLGDTVDPLYNTGSIYTAVHSINTRTGGVQAANPIRSSAAHGLLPSVAVQNARDTEALLSFMLLHCAEIAVAAESLCCNAAQLYGISCSIDAFDKEHLLRRRRWGPADIHLYTDCLFDYVERCYSRLAEALSSVCLGFMGAPSVVEKIFAIPGGINSLVLRPLKTMLEFYERLYAAARCYELRLSAKTNDGMGEYVLNVDASINAERPADFWSSIDEWCRAVRQALQENMAVIEELLLALEEAELLCNNAER
ncbi:hypothetical protein PAPHI01_1296 [Pancytospora philotis]|nr:hypothetical protein PAPHI01_1296 [Pancytospora philotis]